MKSQLAMTNNMKQFLDIFEDLGRRSPGQPRIGMAYGRSGLGKTRAMTLAANRHNAVYLCCNPTWTSRTLLEKLVVALGGETKHRLSGMHDQICSRLIYTGRAVLLDECDCIFEDPKLIETFRSLHDGAEGSTFVLVGMERVRQKMARYPQLERRVGRKVEFLSLGLPDVQKVLEVRCEVGVAEDMAVALHEGTHGHLALICSLIELQIEPLGKELGRALTLDDWGDRPFVT